MKLAEQLKVYIEEAIADTNLFIVEIKGITVKRAMILLDGDEGVKIEDCARVSRHINQKMEEDGLSEALISLEVSSPGVDFPLKFERQYPQHIGRTLAIKLADGKEIEGKLISIDAAVIAVEEKIKEKGKKVSLNNISLALSEIAEAKIKVTF
ncbi:MAG: ribosome maturation factor RimP [Sphingobacteriaceae bacterium]